jgi:hypothetical protein
MALSTRGEVVWRGFVVAHWIAASVLVAYLVVVTVDARTRRRHGAFAEPD